MKCLFIDGPLRGTVREVTAQVLGFERDDDYALVKRQGVGGG